MSYFLIMGRPRSNTAWLSNFFTLPPHAFCLHEELVACDGSLARLRRRLDRYGDRTGVFNSGASDTSLIFMTEEIDEHFPEARVCLVHGDEAPWRRHADALRLPEEFVKHTDEALERALDWSRDNPNVMRLNTLGVDNPAVMAATWEFLTGAPDGFSVERHEVIRRLHVQQPLESIRSRASGEFKPYLDAAAR